jgi:PilZ domain
MIKEKRQARRQPLRYTAWVALRAEQRHGYVVSDISDTGARIDVQDSKTIPDHFVLMLSSNGAARRFCRVTWRKPSQVGVKFERSLADAANAALAPKADASAAPAPDAAAAPAEPAKAA